MHPLPEPCMQDLFGSAETCSISTVVPDMGVTDNQPTVNDAGMLLIYLRKQSANY